MLDISKQSSAAIFPQAHICFTGFSMYPCGTTLVINALCWKSNPRLYDFCSFLELLVSFHVITFLSKKGGIFFLPPLPTYYSYFLLVVLLAALPAALLALVLFVVFAACVTSCGFPAACVPSCAVLTSCGASCTSCGASSVACLSRR